MLYDTIIIGAGISGIGAACHLKRAVKQNTINKKHIFLILEARKCIGGTWSFFQYPGFRSDSDMYTFAYNFEPWKNSKKIAKGYEILNYLKNVFNKHELQNNIIYNTKVKNIKWVTHMQAARNPANTKHKYWQIETTNNKIFKCKYIFNGCGYYSYNEGYTPKEFSKTCENFNGIFVHSQDWNKKTNKNINYQNKHICIIGSGATAVTMAPALIKGGAKKVTVLQRSPSYIFRVPEKLKLLQRFPSVSKILNSVPILKSIFYFIVRWLHIVFSIFSFYICRKYPIKAKRFFINKAKDEFNIHGISKNKHDELIKHFVPKYFPWDQRVCATPDAVYYKYLKNINKFEIITNEILKFNKDGILLKNNKQINCDIIVSATGLKLSFLGDIKIHINNKIVSNNPSDFIIYKGLMLTNLPNFFILSGYTNSSWTLKVDLTCKYCIRLIRYMEKNNYNVCYPNKLKYNNCKYGYEPLIDLSSGYILRNLHNMPKQGTYYPWKSNHQHYIYDYILLNYGKINDGIVNFE